MEQVDYHSVCIFRTSSEKCPWLHMYLFLVCGDACSTASLSTLLDWRLKVRAQHLQLFGREDSGYTYIQGACPVFEHLKQQTYFVMLNIEKILIEQCLAGSRHKLQASISDVCRGTTLAFPMQAHAPYRRVKMTTITCLLVI